MKSQYILYVSLRISRDNVRRTNGRRCVTAVNSRARRGGGSSSFLPDPRVLQEGSRDLIKARRRVERRVATSCKLELTRWPPSPPWSFPLPRFLSSFLKRVKSVFLLYTIREDLSRKLVRTLHTSRT